MENEMRICEECGKQYDLTNWKFIICTECAEKKSKEWADIWIYETLGYNEEVIDFIPKSSIKFFKEAKKNAILSYRINYGLDLKIDLSKDFRQIAKKVKDDLLNDDIPSEQRICNICNKHYVANAIWPYIICTKCAEVKISNHREFFTTEVLDYDYEYLDMIPHPKMNVNEFLITKEKADKDNRANQLNPNNPEHRHNQEKD